MHIVAFDLQTAINVLGSQAFNHITHDSVGPTIILGIFWGMGEDVSDLLIGNGRTVTLPGLSPDGMNPLQERSFVNLMPLALARNSVARPERHLPEVRS
jgi:hypothetical protein